MGKYVPEKHYIGIRGNKDYPLAFMTPEGNDSASKRRKETVDSWTGDENTKKTFVNKPMNGFKLGDYTRRWSTSNVVWRIYDPRGFQLEISSGNMSYLLGNSDIKKGEFTEELVWCRNGKENFLLPINSDEYKTYSSNTTAEKTTVGKLKPGYKILVSNKDQYIFLGKYSFLSVSKSEYYPHQNSAEEIVSNDRLYLLKNERSNTFKLVKSLSNVKLLDNSKEDTKDYSSDVNSDNSHSNLNFYKKIVYVSKKTFSKSLISENLRLKSVETPIYKSRMQSYILLDKKTENLVLVFDRVGNPGELTRYHFYPESEISKNVLGYFFTRNLKGDYQRLKNKVNFHFQRNETITGENLSSQKYVFCLTIDGKEIDFV